MFLVTKLWLTTTVSLLDFWWIFRVGSKVIFLGRSDHSLIATPSPFLSLMIAQGTHYFSLC